MRVICFLLVFFSCSSAFATTDVFMGEICDRAEIGHSNSWGGQIDACHDKYSYMVYPYVYWWSVWMDGRCGPCEPPPACETTVAFDIEGAGHVEGFTGGTVECDKCENFTIVADFATAEGGSSDYSMVIEPATSHVMNAGLGEENDWVVCGSEDDARLDIKLTFKSSCNQDSDGDGLMDYLDTHNERDDGAAKYYKIREIVKQVDAGGAPGEQVFAEYAVKNPDGTWGNLQVGSDSIPLFSELYTTTTCNPEFEQCEEYDNQGIMQATPCGPDADYKMENTGPNGPDPVTLGPGEEEEFTDPDVGVDEPYENGEGEGEYTGVLNAILDNTKIIAVNTEDIKQTNRGILGHAGRLVEIGENVATNIYGLFVWVEHFFKKTGTKADNMPDLPKDAEIDPDNEITEHLSSYSDDLASIDNPLSSMAITGSGSSSIVIDNPMGGDSVTVDFSSWEPSLDIIGNILFGFVSIFWGFYLFRKD